MNIQEEIKNIPDDIKKGVKKSFPSLIKIKDEELRNKVINAWALSLHRNGYKNLEEIPGSGSPGGFTKGTQTDHISGVAVLSESILDVLEETYADKLDVDRDILLAAAICHDIGKPYEYNSQNQKRWTEDPRISGNPALRHTLYGVHIALSVGLPEEIAHVCGCHSREGQFVERSLVNEIIYSADHAWWEILKVAHNWTPR